MAARLTIFRAAAIGEAVRISTERRVEIAHEIVSEHQATAPVDSGAYRNEAHVAAEGTEVRVVNEDETSFYKELGTVDTPAHATMINAARRHGKYSGMNPRRRG